MDLIINRKSNIPLYMQIYEQIKSNILSGIFREGHQLPPERKLAELLGVNRSTVLNAYRELKSNGLVESRVGKGTVVCHEGYKEEVKLEKQILPLDWTSILNKNIHRNTDSNILDLMKLMGKKKVISFATGIANPIYYPVKELEKISSELMKEYKSEMFLHTPIEGLLKFRKSIQNMQLLQGINSGLDEIMVVSGSQQGINLLGEILLEKDDVVIVEEPTYLGALQVFKECEAKIISIPMDKSGMKMDILEATLNRYRPKFIYTIPTFHNPTGCTMSLDRRKQLLKLAYQYQIPIIEDDAYGALRYEGDDLPSLKAMDSIGYVIYLNTFSKVLFPGLRLGWICASNIILKQMALLKQNMDIHASSLGQWMVCKYLDEGYLKEHIEVITKAYMTKRDHMIKALEANGIEGLEYDIPNGGFYIWCKLPKGINGAEILRRTSKRGVTFVNGEVFYNGYYGKDYMRINFTNSDEEEITTGINIISESVREVLEEEELESLENYHITQSIY